MSGAGDAAGRDLGEEEEEASVEGAAAMPEEGGIAAAPRDTHVAAITFLGALKIPVRISEKSSIALWS